jgi:hypothetical protein
MQLRIPLTDLYAAPGFLDASGETAPVLNAARISPLYYGGIPDSVVTRARHRHAILLHKLLCLWGAAIDQSPAWSCKRV